MAILAKQRLSSLWRALLLFPCAHIMGIKVMWREASVPITCLIQLSPVTLTDYCDDISLWIWKTIRFFFLHFNNLFVVVRSAPFIHEKSFPWFIFLSRWHKCSMKQTILARQGRFSWFTKPSIQLWFKKAVNTCRCILYVKNSSICTLEATPY